MLVLFLLIHSHSLFQTKTSSLNSTVTHITIFLYCTAPWIDHGIWNMGSGIPPIQRRRNLSEGYWQPPHPLNLFRFKHIFFLSGFTSHWKSEGVLDSNSHKESNIFKTFPGQKDLFSSTAYKKALAWLCLTSYNMICPIFCEFGRWMFWPIGVKSPKRLKSSIWRSFTARALMQFLL